MPEITNSLPVVLKEYTSFIYAEPFAGSGALLFYMLGKFPNIETAFINDINTELINAYRVIKGSPYELVNSLKSIENKYKILAAENLKKEMFLEIRNLFNQKTSTGVLQAAYLIFLNKTCYNGLYRVNKSNVFNVPFGKNKNPLICDENKIYQTCKMLQKVNILNGDYEKIIDFISPPAFLYLDPPYKPISSTSVFNSYSHNAFDDLEQMRLKNFCDLLTQKNILWLQSNADVRNYDPDNNFFDELYSDYFIKRISAKRLINSKVSKRGNITELLISNYPVIA